MRLPWSSCLLAFFISLFAFLPSASAARVIESKSLTTCDNNSNFTVTFFNVVFSPDNKTLHFDVVGVSSIEGNVTAEIQLVVYGYEPPLKKLDPCAMGLDGMCPMPVGQINIESNLDLPEDIINEIPGIAYGVPDIDGLVRVKIFDADDDGSLITCLEAPLSNQKTVDQKAVGWVTAVIAGLGLIASGVTSGMGHSNTAAHVAANALSLFGFFQAQAIIGMTAVKLPPIVQSWTQNFQWSMGLVGVGFLQDICTWYQLSTGGTPSTLLSTLATTSVSIERKAAKLMRRTLTSPVYQELEKRTNSDSGVAEGSRLVTVRGIDRVAFRADIERTNVFLTGAIAFMVFCFLIAVIVALFKGCLELAAKRRWMKSDKFQDFRHGWKVILKGILFRLVLIGLLPMCVLCLWELTQRDSPAEVVLAVFILLSMMVTLAWASWQVIRLAKRSVEMHKNPAYMLYSDPKCLNKWGFLYIQYRATAYYFVIPVLLVILLKAAFVALAQEASVAQAVALLIIEALFLISVSILRPWMDRKTNVFNISIAAVNFLNVIFLLFFTEVFNQPGLMTGVMGVIFFVLNAVFALVLLIMVLVASFYAVASKNPDTRYQPMQDDRGSFIKSQPQLTDELDALGAAARGNEKGPYSSSRSDDGRGSLSSDSLARHKEDASNVPLPPSTANSGYQRSVGDGPHSGGQAPSLPPGFYHQTSPQTSPYDLHAEDRGYGPNRYR